MQEGFLTVSVFDSTTNRPIKNAKVNIYTNPQAGESQSKIYQNLETNISGQINNINLNAPDLKFSQQPSEIRPYSTYDVEVIADGYEPFFVEGTQILPTDEARQSIPLIPKMRKRYSRNTEEVVSIGEHTLFGNYPPKIPESSLKPLPAPTGFVVLDNPVVPEFIVVHDGLPDNKSATDYWIPYKDYIKNIASSEIYSTWPKATIYANVVAIISFTLNRVFTEWYRSKGYNFTITSTTNFDHKFIYNRNIFTNISHAVDDIFNMFIKRPTTARQPLLAQYCDGKNVQCPNQMTQWGSKSLGDKGYSFDRILKYFYGDEIIFERAPVVSGVPVSFPGYVIQNGSTGKDVRTIQNQLNQISKSYSAIPKVREDGIFGPATSESVKVFQQVFGVPVTGTVDFRTWYELSKIYVAVTKIASLNPKI